MKKITFTQDEIETIKKYAQNACLGGKSNIRGNDRASTLSGDQMTAQLGEAALSKFVTGNILLYEKTRQERDKNKWAGDNGSDLLGYRIDIKTSAARCGLDYPYNLWIREREYHADVLYILAITFEHDVYLLGWTFGKDVKRKNGDRYEMNKRELLPIEKLSLDILQVTG